MVITENTTVGELAAHLAQLTIKFGGEVVGDSLNLEAVEGVYRGLFFNGCEELVEELYEEHFA